jgi:hypothetical protein
MKNFNKKMDFDQKMDFSSGFSSDHTFKSLFPGGSISFEGTPVQLKP